MKKLTFKVSSPKDRSIVSLIKEVNEFSCRIYLDLENGLVTVENVNSTMIDDVIELVDNYYTILGVDIDNTSEEPSDEQNIPAVSETVKQHVVEKTTVEEPDVQEPVKTADENQHTVLEPQSEDDLIIKKVEFQNEYVENRINNFLKTAYWALYNKQATEKEIGDYILTCMSEISMRYSAKPIIEFSIGDIVDVNYGSHLPGEIMGGHVHAIVCNILNDEMAYVIPITKARMDITSQSYLIFNAPEDATYDNESYTGGTAIIDKGKYVRAERFNSVIGKTKPAFFEKLLYQLASTFDFTGSLIEPINEVVETSSLVEDATNEVAEDTCVTEDATNEVSGKASLVVESTSGEDSEKHIKAVQETKSPTRKVGGVELALLEIIGPSLDKLNKSKSIKEQVEDFLDEIGMHATTKIIAQSFVIACDIKKISYESVILELRMLNPSIREDIIKITLQETFKGWLEQHPTLAEKCPKISFMSLLKVFAKKFS